MKITFKNYLQEYTSIVQNQEYARKVLKSERVILSFSFLLVNSNGTV